MDCLVGSVTAVQLQDWREGFCLSDNTSMSERGVPSFAHSTGCFNCSFQTKLLFVCCKPKYACWRCTWPPLGVIAHVSVVLRQVKVHSCMTNRRRHFADNCVQRNLSLVGMLPEGVKGLPQQQQTTTLGQTSHRLEQRVGSFALLTWQIELDLRVQHGIAGPLGLTPTLQTTASKLGVRDVCICDFAQF